MYDVTHGRVSERHVSAGPIPLLPFFDRLRITLGVLLPTMAKGILARRPRIMGLAERLDVDRRAIRILQKVRDKHGDGPVIIRTINRRHAVILSKEHLARVLAEAPVPFTPASDEKTGALGHFEPHVSLISHGTDRAVRRRFNDEVLESNCPNHRLGARFAEVAAEEARALLAYAGPTITWDEFSAAWDRAVRRIVLGDAARDDTRLTELLVDLRQDGNWSSLRPRNKRKFEAFRTRLDWHIARAEPGSLAAALAKSPKSALTAPCSQATHWLFAFDAGGTATYSAMALLGTHADLRERAVREATSSADLRPGADAIAFPFLRSCVLEALRLWPTTMIVHRETTEQTAWATGTIPAGTSVVIFAPFFHRNDRDNPNADRFAPDIWMSDPGGTNMPFIPFSAGPGLCPGRHIVLLAGSAMLAAMLAARDIRLVDDTRLAPEAQLPGTLDHFSLEIDIGTSRTIAPAVAHA